MLHFHPSNGSSQAFQLPFLVLVWANLPSPKNRCFVISNGVLPTRLERCRPRKRLLFWGKILILDFCCDSNLTCKATFLGKLFTLDLSFTRRILRESCMFICFSQELKRSPPPERGVTFVPEKIKRTRIVNGEKEYLVKYKYYDSRSVQKRMFSGLCHRA